MQQKTSTNVKAAFDRRPGDDKEDHLEPQEPLKMLHRQKDKENKDKLRR